MDEKSKKIYKNIVSFQRKPAKMGERFVFNIPKIYVDNNLIDPNYEYKVYCLTVNLKDGSTSLEDFIQYAIKKMRKSI